MTLTLTCLSKYKFIFWTQHNKNYVKIITRNHGDHSKQHFLVLGILYTVCAVTTVWISVTFTKQCMHTHTGNESRQLCCELTKNSHNTHNEYCLHLHNVLCGSPQRWSIFLTPPHLYSLFFLYLQIISASRQHNTFVLVALFPLTYFQSEVTLTYCSQLCIKQSGCTFFQNHIFFSFPYCAEMREHYRPGN